MGDRGVDMQQRTHAGIEPGSLQSGLSIYTLCTVSYRGAPMQLCFFLLSNHLRGRQNHEVQLSCTVMVVLIL